MLFLIEPHKPVTETRDPENKKKECSIESHENSEQPDVLLNWESSLQAGSPGEDRSVKNTSSSGRAPCQSTNQPLSLICISNFSSSFILFISHQRLSAQP